MEMMANEGELRLTQYLVPQRVLDDTRSFLQNRGRELYEGTALWVGRSKREAVEILRLFIPEQIAVSDEDGASVDLTPRAHYTLTDNLFIDEQFHVRIHAHPRKAYHSPRDDANPILTHDGALSVVVPYFGRDPIQMDRCAVYIYERPYGWLQLPPAAVRTTFEITP
jgi:hypothetical protein